MDKDILKENMLEGLAELEHEQWVAWSKQISASEEISKDRLERWYRLWVDYKFLSEEEKEQDRKWARKVLQLLELPYIAETKK